MCAYTGRRAHAPNSESRSARFEHLQHYWWATGHVTKQTFLIFPVKFANMYEITRICVKHRNKEKHVGKREPGSADFNTLFFSFFRHHRFFWTFSLYICIAV